MSHSARPPHYLRQWRKHRGIALEQVRELAEAVVADRVIAEGEEPDLGKIGLSHSTLSRIETFKLPYNQALLELLAEIYGTDPASLIMRNPEDPDGYWSIWDQVPENQRPQALRVIKGVVEGLKTGTDG